MSYVPLIYEEERSRGFIKRLVKELIGLNSRSVPLALRCLSPEFVHWLRYSWTIRARTDQLAPKSDWLIWLLLGGRGSGKTRAGAEWVRERVKNGARRIALVAPTYTEAREVMIEGESGLLSVGSPEERPVYLSSRRRLEWPNGAVGQIFSSEDPDGLRGPQFDTAWADEFFAWVHPADTLANLRLGLRLPNETLKPQLTVTTTPKPTKDLRKLMGAKRVELSRARSHDNAANLAPAFLSAMEEAYGGTRLGRQELGGEVMTDHAGALWTRNLIERACERGDIDQQGLGCHNQNKERSQAQIYGNVHTGLSDIVVAIDPPISSGSQANACGIIVAGVTRKDKALPKAVILHDGTVQGHSPEAWAKAAADLYDFYGASRVVAEGNQGGEMVRNVLAQAAPHMSVKLVYASKSKTARAVPVALLYEQGRVSHRGRFPELEDELAEMGSESPGARASPDRADALVWAVTELLLRNNSVPRVRVL